MAKPKKKKPKTPATRAGKKKKKPKTPATLAGKKRTASAGPKGESARPGKKLKASTGKPVAVPTPASSDGDTEADDESSDGDSEEEAASSALLSDTDMPDVSSSEFSDSSDDSSAVKALNKTKAKAEVKELADEKAATAEDFAWLQLGANQSETWHLVPKSAKQRVADNEEKASKDKKPKTEVMYAGTHQVTSPTSFEGRPEKQVLRWLSTVLLARPGIKAGQEIQAYYDVATKKIIVSSNKNNVNEELQKYLSSEKIKGVYQKLYKPKDDGRVSRHAGKLGRTESKLWPAQKPIIDAIREGRFIIPGPVGKEEDGAHAERRIERYLSGHEQEEVWPEKTPVRDKKSEWDMSDPDLGFLGGVRRPCAACTFALGLVGQVHSGPLWPSPAALKKLGGPELHTEDIESVFLDKGQLTWLTRDKKTGKLDDGHDTDSDSEVDNKKPAIGPKPGSESPSPEPLEP